MQSGDDGSEEDPEEDEEGRERANFRGVGAKME